MPGLKHHDIAKMAGLFDPGCYRNFLGSSEWLLCQKAAVSNGHTVQIHERPHEYGMFSTAGQD